MLISGGTPQKLQKITNEVGASAYFVKPVPSGKLLGYLGPIFQKQDEELGLIGEN